MMSTLFDFFYHQLDVWEAAKQRFDDLKNVEIKAFDKVKLQFNPARMVSTGAKIDKQSLAKRPCFLCAKNRPSEQIVKEFNGKFDILINPFPILPIHFTIPSCIHESQKISGKYTDMLHFVRQYPEILIFYNGPKCGASAPDHLHFQAGKKDILPVFEHWTELKSGGTKIVDMDEDGGIIYIKDYVAPIFAIVSSSIETSNILFNKLYNALPLMEDDAEPMMNVLAWKQENCFVTLVFPRYKHRPDCYFAEGKEQYLVSPGAIDMAGLLVIPRKGDFDKLTSDKASAILREVSLPQSQVEIVVDKLQNNNQDK